MILAPGLLGAVAAALLSAAPTVVDRVAATVNGEVITLGELTERAGEEYRRAEALPAGPDHEAARKKALRRAFDDAIAEKLLASQAAELGLEATDAQIDAAIEDIRKRNGFDEKQLEAALAQQNLDRDSFRKQVKGNLEAYNLIGFKVRSRVKVTDEDVRSYYQRHAGDFAGEEEVRARHIFLPLAAGASPEEEAAARALGDKVLKRLAAGEEFAKVAREVSKGPGAEDGGDLGWLRRGAVQKALEDAAFALKKGQVSGLVRAGPGLHVLKVEERRVGGAKSFDEVKEELRERLSNEQLDVHRRQYIEELRRDAIVEVKLPELKD